MIHQMDSSIQCFKKEFLGKIILNGGMCKGMLTESDLQQATDSTKRSNV